ncbi:MAG: selenide, water dikinase SelD [Pseudomonadaceae bacterium]|nr:selenide, water dikinase SelD [Pseudomonadaceae bacterium]
MQSNSSHTPFVRELVLLGGGHAHVQVLKHLAMNPVPWLRTTVIAREVDSPYSGMLPGYVSGAYDSDSLHIDLLKLCRFAGARLIADEAVALDATSSMLTLAAGADCRYDVLSINIGGAPTAPAGAIPVKPIGQFVPAWEAIKPTLDIDSRLAVVGAGAGGVELALAMANALPTGARVALVHRGEEVFDDAPAKAANLLAAALDRHGVEVITGFSAREVKAGKLVSDGGATLAADHVFWTTGVAAAGFLADSELRTSESGFVVVGDTLASVSHSNVFAVGDCSHFAPDGLPKAGVYAVRQGPVLARNLISYAAGELLTRYRPQRTFLTLIGTGDERAVAIRGNWVAEGAWVWRWKDWIDQRFMARFNDLPPMPLDDEAAGVPENLLTDAPSAMRCAGCGAKVAADPLIRVLHRLDIHVGEDVVIAGGDDAALMRWPNASLLATADAFRSMVDDPYRFGRIAAHHSLSDIFAMGGTPTAALALATVPAMADALMEDDLYRLMRGALDVLEQHDVSLIGGHSAEAAETSLGFAILAQPGARTLSKAGMRPGDALVLTKPVGTGVLLAAAMRGELAGKHYEGLLATLDSSNAHAASVLAPLATAMTDITGFGVAGHAVEMADASGCGLRLDLGRLPILDGAARAIEAGVRSSLFSGNQLALKRFDGGGQTEAAIFADPQTSGGLLASVPAQSVPEILNEIPGAASIGEACASGFVIERR